MTGQAKPRQRALRRDAGVSKSWTRDQDDALRELWPTDMPAADVLAQVNALGPVHSGGALRMRAHGLRLERPYRVRKSRAGQDRKPVNMNGPARKPPPFWTDAQDAILRASWPAGTPAAEIAAKVTEAGPPRSASGVLQRVKQLGLRRAVRPKPAPRAKRGYTTRTGAWSGEQVAILRAQWETTKTVAAIVAEINAVPDSIAHDEAGAYAMASKLKLRRPPSALARWRKRGQAVAADPLDAALRAQMRVEVRDGVKVTVCPPAYAWGGWRAGRVAGKAARGMT